MNIARRCRVRGRVQGVGFRYYVAGEATALGVSGFVRNRFDGSVEVVVEGDEVAVSALLEKVRQGPRWSQVEHIQLEELVLTGRYTNFRITG